VSPLIAVVNPGGGTTRLAVYRGEQALHSAELRHGQDELQAASGYAEQLALRHRAACAQLGAWGIELDQLAAAVGRGGPYRPLPGGVYAVGPALLDDVRAGRIMADHPSKLGAELAWRLAQPGAGPAFVVDPVSVDELADVARLTGLPELPRVSLWHALNIKAVAQRHARTLGARLADLRLIVAHLGSGVSVALLAGGEAIDVNNSADEGPFSARRAGGLPATGLLALASRPGFEPAEIKRRMMAGAGLLAHTGSADLAEVESRAAAGDDHAALVIEAMAYNVAKAIGAMAAAAAGEVDGILLTGGMARGAAFLDRVEARVRWIAAVHRYPGEDELRALAEGASAALRGERPILDYPDGRPRR